MKKSALSSKLEDFPAFLERDGKVIGVSELFRDLTEFKGNRFISDKIEDVFLSLKIGPDFDINNLEEQRDYFMFTESLDIKFFNIKTINEQRERLYIFLEIPNSKLEDKFPVASTMCSDNYYGIAFFSMPDMTLLKANDKYIGYIDAPNNSKENCIGKHIYEFVSGFKGSAFQDIWDKVFETGKSFNIDEIPYKGLRRGITYWTMSLTPVLVDSKIKYCVLMINEITDRVLHKQKVEEQTKIIAQQKELLEAVLDNMTDALMVFDKDGNYVLKNNAALKGRNIDSYKHIGDGYKPGVYYDMKGNEIPLSQVPSMRVLNGERIIETILNVKYSDRESFAGVSGTPIYDSQGNFRLGIMCIRDVTFAMLRDKTLQETQEKLLTAEREKNEALEMKDEFLTLISHEFRTPLNVINTAIQAMEYFCSGELSDKAKKYLGMMKLNTFRQLRLVNNLLDFTRADAGRIKIRKRNIDIVFLTRAITESVQTYALQKGVYLSFTSPVEKKVIGIDDEKYERILLNLLSNAIKFTPSGKSINVKLTSEEGSICVEVIDTGIGIPENKVNVIFERFGQVDSSLSRQAEGTGIGLSLVKKFVEALGGSISLRSKVGEGSTFTILLRDEAADEVSCQSELPDLMDNHLVHTTNVEFSDIYL